MRRWGGWGLLALFLLMPLLAGCSGQATGKDEAKMNRSGADAVLAMVLLSQPAFPAADRLVAHLGERVGPVTYEERFEQDGLAMQVFWAGERRIDLMLMPLPVPWSELEGPCATNPFWREATPVCRAHQAHLIVRVSGPGADHRAALPLLTSQVVAAVVDELSAPAVYWGGGGVVSEGKRFAQAAREASASDLPLHLWISFRVWQPADGRLYVATTGLKEFGLTELEGESARLQPIELIGKVYDLAHYLIQQGPVIGDGDTVGGSATERIRVERRPSVWERDPVLFIAFDGAARKGFFSRLMGR